MPSSTATLGPATVTFTATSGTLSRTTSVSLTVTGTGDFTVGPGSATSVTRGSTASSVIAINRTSFTGAVSFSASGLPSGVTVAFSPATATTGNSVTATFTASSTATLGTAQCDHHRHVGHHHANHHHRAYGQPAEVAAP